MYAIFAYLIFLFLNNLQTSVKLFFYNLHNIVYIKIFGKYLFSANFVI